MQEFSSTALSTLSAYLGSRSTEGKAVSECTLAHCVLLFYYKKNECHFCTQLNTQWNPMVCSCISCFTLRLLATVIGRPVTDQEPLNLLHEADDDAVIGLESAVTAALAK